MKFDTTKLEWTREPESYSINEDKQAPFRSVWYCDVP